MPEDLLSSIRTVAAGDSLLSPTATRALITRFLAAPDTDGFLALPEAVRALTDLEREVTALAAYCKSNTDIAEQLVLSPLTRPSRSMAHSMETRWRATAITAFLRRPLSCV